MEKSIFDTVPLEHFVILSLILFCIGMIGVLRRRNMIVVFMSIELMLNAVNLLAVAFSAHRGDPSGQVFVFFVMVVAAAEVALGLGILMMIYRNVKSVDINALKQLKW
ncbi:NADH-quinone oxidoreductase subunit NuoK [Haliscomenobacter sp.]|uniref:NADH-quinone oxidoreductase subunit NuoK n=1 Tax=Haliscomenobacter sp. TaxID=2717303 RepID=UPI003BAB34BA